mgnify:CR=1 FL=1
MTAFYKKISAFLSPQVVRLREQEAPSPSSPFFQKLQALVGASPVRVPQTPSDTGQLIADSETWLDRLGEAMNAYQRSVSAEQSTIVDERDGLRQTLADLQEEVSALRERVGALHTENGDLVAKVELIEAQLRGTSELNERLKEELRNFERVQAEQAQELDVLKRELHASAQALVEQREDHAQKTDVLAQTIKSLEADTLAVVEEKGRVETEKAQLLEAKQAAEAQHVLAMKKLSTKYAEIDAQLTQQTSLAESRDAHILQLQSTRQREVAELETQFAVLRTENERKIRENQIQLDTVVQRSDQLSADLEDQKGAMKDLRDQLQEKEVANTKLLEKVKRREAAIEAATKAAETLRKKLDSERSRSATLEKELAALQAQLKRVGIALTDQTAALVAKAERLTRTEAPDTALLSRGTATISSDQPPTIALTAPLPPAVQALTLFPPTVAKLLAGDEAILAVTLISALRKQAKDVTSLAAKSIFDQKEMAWLQKNLGKLIAYDLAATAISTLWTGGQSRATDQAGAQRILGETVCARYLDGLRQLIDAEALSGNFDAQKAKAALAWLVASSRVKQ